MKKTENVTWVGFKNKSELIQLAEMGIVSRFNQILATKEGYILQHENKSNYVGYQRYLSEQQVKALEESGFTFMGGDEEKGTEYKLYTANAKEFVGDDLELTHNSLMYMQKGELHILEIYECYVLNTPTAKYGVVENIFTPMVEQIENMELPKFQVNCGYRFGKKIKLFDKDGKQITETNRFDFTIQKRKSGFSLELKPEEIITNAWINYEEGDAVQFINADGVHLFVRIDQINKSIMRYKILLQKRK